MFKRIVTVLLKSTLTTTKTISPFDVEEASVEVNWRTIFQLVLAWFIVVDLGVRSLWWWKLVHQHLRSKRCQWLRTSVRALRGAHPTGKCVTRKRHASDAAVEEWLCKPVSTMKEGKVDAAKLAQGAVPNDGISTCLAAPEAAPRGLSPGRSGWNHVARGGRVGRLLPQLKRGVGLNPLKTKTRERERERERWEG
jgi:hypothetical protein